MKLNPTLVAQREVAMHFTCRPLSLAELPLLNDLYNECYHANRPLEEAEWLYAKNPDGPALIMAAFDEHNELAGVRPTIARRFSWRGQERISYEFADALVSPRHRKRGIFTQLVKLICEHAERRNFTLFTIPNGNSLPIYQRTPMLQVIGTCETRVKVLSLTRYAGYRMGLNGQRKRGSIARLRSSQLRDGDIRLTPITRFDCSFEQVHAGFQPVAAGCPVRRSEYLQWRYFGSPVREYHVALIEQRGEVQGYFVVRLLQGVAHLIDAFLKPDPQLLRGAFGLLTDWCASLGGIAIRFNASQHNPFGEVTANSGYWLKRSSETLVIDRKSADLFASDNGGKLDTSHLYFVMGDFDFL